MVKYQTLKQEIVKAMKEKDVMRKDVLRMLVSEIETKRVALNVADVSELTEVQVEGMVKTFLKALRNEKEVFLKLGSNTEKVEKQISVIEGLLPKELSEAETVEKVNSIIAELVADGEEISMKTMGKIKQKLGKLPVNMAIVSATLKKAV